MKSMAFKNLVLAFYLCGSFLLFHLIDYNIKKNEANLNISLINIDFSQHTEIVSFFITLPFFVLILISVYYKKVMAINAIYFIFLVSICIILKKDWFSPDSIITFTVFLTTSIFLISFSQHSNFIKFNYFSKDNDTILDKFEESNQDKIEQKPYFLRVNRILSFAFTSIGIGILLLSTQTGGHISVDEGLGLSFLGFVIIGFAALLWKFPKIGSSLAALICLGMFIWVGIDFIKLEVMSIHNTQEITEKVDWLRIIFALVLDFSFLFLALIAVSKTAREEWKMN